MEAKTKRGRWIALGTVFGLVAVWGGFGVLGAAAPSSITTCTSGGDR